MEQITSNYLRKLYKGNPRDVGVYEVNDSRYPGFQIIRRYTTNTPDLADKKMFIKFFLLNEEDTHYVLGGVDMVRDKNKDDAGWPIVSSEKGFLRKYTGYFFNKSEDIIFNPKNNKVIFKNKEFSVTEFIDQLEGNHNSDMFLKSRVEGCLKRCVLHSLFFLTDDEYKWTDHIGENREGFRKSVEKSKDNLKLDPLFHYFNIFKNLLGTSIFAMIVPVYYLSKDLPVDFFTVTNPLWLFSSLFLLYILDKLSLRLQYVRMETDFVQQWTISSIENKGKLKVIS